MLEIYSEGDIFDQWDARLDALFTGSRGQYELREDSPDDVSKSTLYVNAIGYKSEDLSVEMREGRLSITGALTDRKTVLVPNKIDLRFSVNSNVLIEAAELHDGLLAIHLTRASKSSETVKIPVQS